MGQLWSTDGDPEVADPIIDPLHQRSADNRGCRKVDDHEANRRVCPPGDRLLLCQQIPCRFGGEWKRTFIPGTSVFGIVQIRRAQSDAVIAQVARNRPGCDFISHGHLFLSSKIDDLESTLAKPTEQTP